MMIMALLVHLPLRLLAVLSVSIIGLHNLLDGVDSSKFGSAARAWKVLHQPGVVFLAGRQVLITYTLLPWIGVMAAGFCFATLYTLDGAVRRRYMIWIGVATIVAFILLRSFNHYGDPVPWASQKSFLLTILSFLNCTKYPGSLDFVLMTLGPAILLLASFDDFSLSSSNPLIVFGRVPMFYFVLHFYLIHTLLVVMSFLRYGVAASNFIFNPPPSMGGPAQLFPENFGYSLGVVYIIWVCLVVALYPACRWFARIKARRRDWWLSYL
jgi:uncharacterized membrane protein